MADELKSALRRVCELQPQYTAENTPAMEERGRLIRGVIKDEILALRPILSSALGRFGDDFHVSASDGIGPKTELPWIRFCSKEMSPKPTEGFYCVLHFSTSGEAFHITVGCGSSRFFNGYSVVLPDAELDKQSAWAREVITETFGTIAPFDDARSFGATRRLPKSFERATAVSQRIDVTAIDATDLTVALQDAAVRLQLLYEAQSIGRDLSPADQAEIELIELANPKRSGKRQGFGLPPAAKRAVELKAMELSEAWLVTEGFSVRDCSANQPFDFEATRDGATIKVEVKGTTSDRADAILMTRNEVELHRAEQGATALLVVTKIRLSLVDGNYTASGGELDCMLGWDIGQWTAEPTAFRLTRPLP